MVFSAAAVPSPVCYHVFFRYFGIVHHQISRNRTPKTDFMLLPSRGKSLRPFFDKENGKLISAFRVLPRLCGNQRQIRHMGIGYEAFPAVYDPSAVYQLRQRRLSRDIRPPPGSVTARPRSLSRRNSREGISSSVLRTEFKDRRHRQLMGKDNIASTPEYLAISSSAMTRSVAEPTPPYSCGTNIPRIPIPHQRKQLRGARSSSSHFAA
jgi:hypothetical protein